MSEQEDTKIERNHVIGVVATESHAQEAIDALNEAGFTDNTVMSHVDAPGEGSNPLVALWERFAGHFSDDVQIIEQYQEQTDQGRYVVAVKVDDQEQAEKAKDIMELKAGAMNIRFFGLLAVTDLTPATNPNVTAEESPQGPI